MAFWIPVVIAAAGKVITDLNKAESNIASAKTMNLKTLNRMGDARRGVFEQQEKTKMATERLANRKRGILITSIVDFIKIYEQLMKIEFIESDGIKELSNPIQMQENLRIIQHISSVAGTIINEMELISFTLLSGGKLLCMGGLIGSTVGVPIGGAAATFLNPVFLPASIIMATTHSIVKDSKQDLKLAEIRKKQSQVIVAQAETNIEVLKAMEDRAVRLADLLAKLNMLFVKAIKTTAEIITKNKKDKSMYTLQDKEYIRNCLNFADAVKVILDTPLFEENGQLAECSKIALDTGEHYLAQIEQVAMK